MLIFICQGVHTFKSIGIVLIVIGTVGLIYGDIISDSGRGVGDVASMYLEVEPERHMPYAPIAGGLALGAGLILVIAGRHRLVRSGIAWE